MTEEASKPIEKAESSEMQPVASKKEVIQKQIEDTELALQQTSAETVQEVLQTNITFLKDARAS